MDIISRHKLLSLVVLVLLIGAAWYGFTQSSPSASVLSATGTSDATGTQDTQIVTTLLQLQAVTLSGTILTDPGFLSLQNYTTQIVEEPIGRQNPFAPLSPGTVTTATSTPVSPDLFAPAKH